MRLLLLLLIATLASLLSILVLMRGISEHLFLAADAMDADVEEWTRFVTGHMIRAMNFGVLLACLAAIAGREAGVL